MHATGDRLLGNVVAGEASWIGVRVRVEIERNPCSLGGIEKPVDMAVLILIHIRTSTQYRQSHLEGFPQHALGHVVMKDAFLRKRHQL